MTSLLGRICLTTRDRIADLKEIVMLVHRASMDLEVIRQSILGLHRSVINMYRAVMDLLHVGRSLLGPVKASKILS
jgi:hypothetical protein